MNATSRTRGTRPAGFTLVEMVVVLGVIAILLGAGVGLIGRLKVGDRAAVGIVETTLRSARNWAVARDAPARVRIDAQGNALQALGLSVVGTWHFEDLPITGAFGVEGASLGGELVDDGFQGRALSFAGEPPRSRVELPVHVDTAFDLSRGFSIQCAVRPESDAAGDLLAIGESVGLSLTADGGVATWIAPELVEEGGGVRRGGRIPLATTEGWLRPQAWSQIEVQYDRRVLSILVDGALAAQVAEDAPVWRVEGPLVLSPASAAFPGAIDALAIAAVTGEERRELPKGVAFAPGAPAQVVFEAGGGLDRAVHPEPVKLALKFDDGREETIVVNLYGTVE